MKNKTNVVCIVGSRDVEQTRARSVIESILSGYTSNNTVVISGGRGNVDLMAERVAGEMGFMFVPFLPRRDSWIGGYKERNWIMAAACTILYRVTVNSPGSYGSGWTRDKAVEMGKPTKEIVVDVP